MSAGLSLRLIGASDLHANILAYDHYRDRPDDTVGLAKTASLIDPDSSAEQPLPDANFASYNFDVVDGVTCEIDVTRPSRYDSDGKLVAPDAHRNRNLAFRGAPIEPSQFFIVVTNNYRASGGGNFPGCDGSTVVFEAPDSNRDVMVRYIVETRRLEPKSDGNWRFTPWPAHVVATVSTSPAAASARPPASVTVTPMGAAPGGFVKYRVEPKWRPSARRAEKRRGASRVRSRPAPSTRSASPPSCGSRTNGRSRRARLDRRRPQGLAGRRLRSPIGGSTLAVRAANPLALPIARSR